MHSMPIKNLHGKRGFTLVEALISSLIVGISLLSVGTALYSQVKALNLNREKTIATLAAQGEIENIRGREFDSISNYTFDTTEAPGLIYLKKPPALANRGSVTVSGVYSSDIKKIVVTITWLSPSGKTLQSKLITLVARGGIDKQ